MQQQKVWFITGISRGLGKSLAMAALHAGDKVIGTSRSGEVDLPANENFTALALDVNNESDIKKTIALAAKKYGRLDVVVNNAGYSILGAVEEITSKEAHDQFETCFFGPLAIIQAVLPVLRAQNGGHIINVSSVAGVAPTSSAVVYAASKFALEGLSEGLAQEVATFGIKITIVEPGAFRTDFLSGNSIKLANALPAYTDTVGKAREKFDSMNGSQRGNPEKAAKIIVDIAHEENPPLHLILGMDAYERVEKKLNSRVSEMQRLKTITASTDF